MKNGFTIMEMMVVLVIFSLVMGIAFTAIKLNDVSRDNVNIQIELYNKNKQVHNTIAEELSRSSFSKDGTGNLLRINTSTSPCTLTTPCFQIAIGTDINYDTIWGANDDSGYWIHYKLDGTNLVREILDAVFSNVSQRIISSNVIAFSITVANNPILINTTVQKKRAMGDYIPLSALSQVNLRND